MYSGKLVFECFEFKFNYLIGLDPLPMDSKVAFYRKLRFILHVYINAWKIKVSSRNWNLKNIINFIQILNENQVTEFFLKVTEKINCSINNPSLSGSDVKLSLRKAIVEKKMIWKR